MTRLRAFISSTMEDLANERRAVVRRLSDLGIEPVNAENISPSGQSSWERIKQEIETCQIVILILGERYGWVPPEDANGKSVTHLEYDYSRSKGKIILPFQKKLKYGAERDTDRDSFRREVADWQDGMFRQEFELADDLSELVRKAIIDLFNTTLLNTLADRASRTPAPIPARIAPPSTGPSAAASRGEGVLIAGAGMSLPAGMPAASLLVDILSDELWNQELPRSDRFNFSDVAEYYVFRFGKQKLVDRLVTLMKALGRPRPTSAHLKAVTHFSAIITTNYDSLFEEACKLQGVPYVTLLPGAPIPETGNHLAIYKMIGSLESPESLRLTQQETFDDAKSELVSMARELVTNNPVTIIGHALRDGFMPEILMHRTQAHNGILVTPFENPLDDILLNRFKLTKVNKTADDFMARLQRPAQALA
ncbi:DUF4062 domain-containing protein [Stenotrophomonas sp. 24(2023)]|uniref:DUF4062 domain-containing protein n=1 Tax=Stenotrophomonas sp. 24(2023) TaxID=3068324 RepID=UPI0027DEE348|nr:DUF4062 domain-containing protein [Stenotrophomonas sp. 24(2023)]WMJ70119.1 DUF4062 domain-containing protein [Stenotrophomonas sp. 24(2023)]